MSDTPATMDEEMGELEARRAFEKEIGAAGVATKTSTAGSTEFLKFVVGREAPIYQYALRATQKSLSEGNPFRGTLGLLLQRNEKFPASLEATALLTLLTRSTRVVAQDTSERGFLVPYVPFQNQEDHKLAQAASHVVIGRRGVGKSTLIRRAVEILRESAALVAVVDVQAYSTLSGNDLQREVLQEIIRALIDDVPRVSKLLKGEIDVEELQNIASDLTTGHLTPNLAVPRIKRCVQQITKATRSGAFVFLDDFHLLNWDDQPKVLHVVHGTLKGANGWIKVAGLRSLLNYYSAGTREGLQVPGDAQIIPLDLTLENPEAAESHLRAILESFLKAVGYQLNSSVLPETAFKRLAWANAGVPRDFLQMFARAVEHARRNKHSVVTLSDVNVAIGEFGQQKMNDLSQDARNSAGELRTLLALLETYCLDENLTNAFLISIEESNERRLVHILNDLRLVHLINQSITPDRAGERYEAYILDYSLFTGFRRRQSIREMVPEYGHGQFKVAALRGLPKVTSGFIEQA